jgi:hypothetical protein
MALVDVLFSRLPLLLECNDLDISSLILGRYSPINGKRVFGFMATATTGSIVASSFRIRNPNEDYCDQAPRHTRHRDSLEVFPSSRVGRERNELELQRNLILGVYFHNSWKSPPLFSRAIFFRNLTQQGPKFP